MPSQKWDAPTKTVAPAELNERGWTIDLRVLHLHLDHGRYIRAEADAVEETAGWKHDAARAAAGHAILYTTAELKSRGWTTAMIKDWLRAHAVVIPLDDRGVRVQHRYKAELVEEVEASDEFAERVAAAEKRRTRAKEVARNRARVLLKEVEELADSLWITPPRTLVTLQSNALDHQEDRYDDQGVWRSVAGADAETVDRWCRNYLRHVCSNYEHLLDVIEYQYRGRPGVRDTYEVVVRPRIDAMVDEVVKRLQDEATSSHDQSR